VSTKDVEKGLNKCLKLYELSKSNKKTLTKPDTLTDSNHREEPKKIVSARKALGQKKSIQDSIDRMIKARLVICMND
jgi:ribosomal protein S9